MRSRTLLLVLLVLVVLAVAASGPASAAERIRFKNGHVLVVERSRLDGDMIYLTLQDKSEVGFPKALVILQEAPEVVDVTAPAGTPANYAGRGKPLGELPGQVQAVREAQPNVFSNVRIAQGGKRSPATYGFSYMGSGDAGAPAPSGPPPQASATSRPSRPAPVGTTPAASELKGASGTTNGSGGLLEAKKAPPAKLP
ncbi:MAG: hypothetical protein KBD01_19700 [Acidobacteria bacterium]|nr:hypothetical protein [Acidobacteriota bacterium]